MTPFNPARRSFLKTAGYGLAGFLLAAPRTAETTEAAELSLQTQKLLGGLTWFKQSGFRLLDGETVIYFDPYQLTETTNDADIILISHSHGDHCDTGSIRKIAKDSTKVVTEPESEVKINRYVSDITIVAPGDTVTAGGIKIEAVASYNINKTNHPKSKNYLGFVVTLRDGRRFYHAGDTDKIPEMDSIDTNVALLPCGGTFTMNASEAVEAAKAIQSQIVVPMHYGSAVGSVRDAETVQQQLEGIIETVIFDPGQTIEPPVTKIPSWFNLD